MGGDSPLGGAGAPTGFARTIPMKGRARRRSWIARVRISKSDFFARRADSRRFAVGFISCIHMKAVHEIEVHLISTSVFSVKNTPRNFIQILYRKSAATPPRPTRRVPGSNSVERTTTFALSRSAPSIIFEMPASRTKESATRIVSAAP